MTGEQLFILMMFGLVLLINLIARLLRRWIGREAPREVEPERIPIPPDRRRQPSPAVPQRRAPTRELRATLPSALTASAPRRRRHWPLRSRREVRRAIVLMTILGPCRALEPPGPRM
jgi:hypothetical protein